MRDSKKRLQVRKLSIRNRLHGTVERPRLCVYRGHAHIYAQLVDDNSGKTITTASTLSPEIKGTLKSCDTVVASQAVGSLSTAPTI